MEKAEAVSESWIKQHYPSVAHAVMDSDRITSPIDKLVGLELALRWPQIYPSVETIAERCCLSRRSVFTALKSLSQLQIIQIERRQRRNGGDTSSLYRFVDVAIPQYRKRPGDGGGGVQQMPTGDADPAPGGVQQAHPQGVQELHPKDQGLTRKLKVVGTRARTPAARRTRATPAARFTSLDGWDITPALRAEWLTVAKLACSEARALELLEARVQRLRRKAIGGAYGVTDRDGYVRDHFEQWGKWERENLEKASRGAGLGPRSSFWGGGGGWQPSREMRAFGATWRIDVDSLAERFVSSGECERRGCKAEADRAFIARLHAAARKVNALCIECGGSANEPSAARRHKASCSRAPRRAAA